MNKRLDTLEKMIKSGSADSFTRYALAMEYRKEERFVESLEAFIELRNADSDYLPMYLMAGQLLLEQKSNAEAQEWLEAGIEVAEEKSDIKALSELEDALAEC